MFYRRSDHRRRSGPGITGIFRMLVSLVMLSILGFGLVLAYKNFSGYDPLTTNPQAIAKSLLSSEGLIELLTSLLTFSPDKTLDKAKELLGEDSAVSEGSGINSTSDSPIIYKFAIISDSHKSTANLKRALDLAKGEGVKFVIGMGDFSDVGTIDELRDSMSQFDASGLPYYIGAGDHDLWDSRDKGNAAETNFKEVFGAPYQSFSFENLRMVIIYNSDNYFGVDDLQMRWLEEELARIQNEEPGKLLFVFAPTPIYHPSSDHVMGKVTPKLKTQAEYLASIFKRNYVKEVFSADTHFFSRYQEPTNELPMTTVGAVTAEKNPQTPRFVMVDVREDQSYNVREVEVK